MTNRTSGAKSARGKAASTSNRGVRSRAMSISDLKPDVRNANAGTVRGLAMLEDSIGKYGAGRSILVDKSGNVIAGNKTFQAAVDADMPIEIVESDGTKLVVVQRTDLDLYNDPKARMLAYADNRVAELDLSWSADALLADIADGVDLSALWDQDELDALLGASDEPTGDPGAQMDKASELQQKWQVQRGDLWTIGKHRLLCGDSTEAADVARVMGGERARIVVTSPPYNQNLDAFKPSGMQKESTAFVDRMASSYYDSLPEDEYQSQQVALLEMLPQFMMNDGSIFYNHKVRYREKEIVSPITWLSKLSYPIRQEIIWDRGSSITLNARMFIPADERIYWLRVGDNFIFNDEIEIKSWSTVWDIAAHNDVSISAAYATEIPLRCIRAASRPDDCVLEPYSGSGTTLVACEQTGRRGRAIEIEAKYVAVALERLSAMGLAPVKAEA